MPSARIPRRHHRAGRRRRRSRRRARAAASSSNDEAVRRAAGVAMRSLAGTRKVAISLGTQAHIAAVAEGALLGAYSYLRYRNASRDAHQPPVDSVVLVVDDPKSSGESQAARSRRSRLRGGGDGARPGEHPAVRSAPEGVRRHRRDRGEAGRSRHRDSRREGAEKGRLRRHYRRRPRVDQPAATGAPAVPAPEGDPHPRPRRQGHHVRLGRPVVEASLRRWSG